MNEVSNTNLFPKYQSVCILPRLGIYIRVYGIFQVNNYRSTRKSNAGTSECGYRSECVQHVQICHVAHLCKFLQVYSGLKVQIIFDFDNVFDLILYLFSTRKSSNN